ncbi:MAG: sulfatase [Bacteroidota bacterium]
MYPGHIGAQHMRTGPWYGNFPREVMLARYTYGTEQVPPYEAVPPPEVVMHGEYLRRQGYYCTNNPKEDYQFYCPLTAWDERGNQAHWRNRTPGQPFFSIFNLAVTHESQIWARGKDSLWVDEDLDVPVPPYLPTTEKAVQDVRRMYSNIKIMDHQVGELLAELEAANLMDSTIIFWYTDHGGPLPRQKRLCYDSGLRLPMIVRFPGKKHAGEVDDRLISFIDFLPTLLSLTGQKPPEYLDGQAFLGEYAAAPRTYIHGAADRFDAKYDKIRAVRDQRYKYLRNFNLDQPYYLPVSYREQMPIMQELLRLKEEGKLDEYQAQWFRETKVPEELFDTENDPHELHNLAEDPAYSEKLTELRTECDRWLQAIDDKGLLEEPEFLKRIWPDGTQPMTARPEVSIKTGKAVVSSATEGATLAYQIVAENETLQDRWDVYTGPISIKDGESVYAVAQRIGYLRSDTAVVSSP